MLTIKMAVHKTTDLATYHSWLGLRIQRRNTSDCQVMCEYIRKQIESMGLHGDTLYHTSDCFCLQMVDIVGKNILNYQAHNLKVVGSNPTPATILNAAFPMGQRHFCERRLITKFINSIRRDEPGANLIANYSNGYGA